MNNYNFEVKFPKSDLVGFFLCYSVFAIANIFMFIIGFNFKLSVLLAVYLVPIAVLMIYTTLMFSVKVNENTFKVRTRIGKRYQFDIVDIKRITCSKKMRVKTGPRFLLTIVTNDHELELDSKMKNFDKMATYFLQKLDSRELNQKCISKNTKEELTKYSQNAYAPK